MRQGVPPRESGHGVDADAAPHGAELGPDFVVAVRESALGGVYELLADRGFPDAEFGEGALPAFGREASVVADALHAGLVGGDALVEDLARVVVDRQ